MATVDLFFARFVNKEHNYFAHWQMNRKIFVHNSQEFAITMQPSLDANERRNGGRKTAKVRRTLLAANTLAQVSKMAPVFLEAALRPVFMKGSRLTSVR